MFDLHDPVGQSIHFFLAESDVRGRWMLFLQHIISMCILYIYTYIQYIYIHMSQLSNHQSLFFAYFSLRNDMVHKNRSRRFERNQPLEVLEGLPQYLQNDLRSWVWPPPRIPVTTRLTLQFFNRESRTKPFFVTIASWGATPKLEVPSTQILGWDPFLLPMHKASHTHNNFWSHFWWCFCDL